MSVSGPWFGVYPARVTSVQDPEGQGRVRVVLPWAPDARGKGTELWARLATLMAGSNRGTWFVPDVGDEALVAFESGDPRRPYVIGALWNGKDAPPVREASGRNDTKVLRTRSGITITLSDDQGHEQIALETPGGQRLTLKDGPGAVEMVDGNGNAIRLQPSGITVTATAKVTVQAAQVTIAAGSVQIDSGLVQCSGVLKADAVVTNSVVSASYSPGAGNVM